nr:MAG TPA: hypothetical protein [Caudoviricetes sp.]
MWYNDTCRHVITSLEPTVTNRGSVTVVMTLRSPLF